MMIEVEPLFYNRTGRRNDITTGHETTHCLYNPLNPLKVQSYMNSTYVFPELKISKQKQNT